ncbi:MAG: hypothetical protein WBW53_00410 [Terriglobales bacterium]
MLGFGVGFGAGFAAAGLPSALVALAALSFAVFASLFSATTGTAIIANTNKIENQVFIVNMDGFSLFRPRSNVGQNMGRKIMSVLNNWL